MPLIWETVTSWCQTGKRWSMDLFCYGHSHLMAKGRPLVAGIMFSLAGAASVFSSNPDVPRVFLYGAILGFAVSTTKYVLQNLNEIIRYIVPTAFTLLAITIFIFHGFTSLNVVFVWLPVFISTTLLATTSIAPGATEIFIVLGEGISTIRELRELIGAPRNPAEDLEQAQDLALGMTELQTIGNRRRRSIGSIWSYIHRLPELRNLESPEEESGESISLDDSIPTSSRVREVAQPLDLSPNFIPQYIAITNIGSLDEQRTYFPDAPQGPPSEMSPGIEEPVMESLIPAGARTEDLNSESLLPA